MNRRRQQIGTPRPVIPPEGYRYVRRRWHVVCALADAVGWLTVGLARWIGRMVRQASGVSDGGDRNVPQPAPPRRILLVQLDHLGDAVLTTSILPPLKACWPDASIDVLAGPVAAEVFAAAPQVDRVMVSQSNRFARSGRLPLLWLPAMILQALRLRRKQYDLAVDVRGDLTVALLLWLAGAKRRIGWAAGGGAFLLTRSVAYRHGRPELQSRRLLLEAMTDRPTQTSMKPKVHPSRAALERANGWCEHLVKGEDRRPLVALHLGAGTQAKQWPDAHWRELIGRLIVELDARLVLVGDRREREHARAVLGDRGWPGVMNLCGLTNIDELAALLGRADLAVSCDSGPAHLAAAVGTPLVVLFSGSVSFPQWQPRGRRVMVCRRAMKCAPCHAKRCPLAGHPCMSGLLPEEVMSAVRRLANSLPTRFDKGLADESGTGEPRATPWVSEPDSTFTIRSRQQ